MILVTGGTGTVGTELVRQLAEAGKRVRVLARHPERSTFWHPNVERFAADLLIPKTLDRAMAGVDRMFLIAAGMEQLRMEHNAIEAAKRAGVRHVVKLSVKEAEGEYPIPLVHWHQHAEKQLRDSGLDWTVLRATSFMNNDLSWASTIKARGAVFNPTGDGKLGVIDAADVAAAAVKVLTEPGHEGKVYCLTGAQDLNARERAAELSEMLDRELDVVEVSLDQATEAMIAAGIPHDYARVLARYQELIREGRAEGTTPDLVHLLGHTPRSYETWARAHASAFVG